MKDKYLIIDGYNMIGQSPELGKIAKDNLQEAREQLLDAIANYNVVMKLYVCLMHMNNQV